MDSAMGLRVLQWTLEGRTMIRSYITCAAPLSSPSNRAAVPETRLAVESAAMGTPDQGSVCDQRCGAACGHEEVSSHG